MWRNFMPLRVWGFNDYFTFNVFILFYVLIIRSLFTRTLLIVISNFYSLIRLMSWNVMIGVVFEVMQYFGLNHRPSSGVKLKEKEHLSFYIRINNSSCSRRGNQGKVPTLKPGKFATDEEQSTPQPAMRIDIRKIFKFSLNFSKFVLKFSLKLSKFSKINFENCQLNFQNLSKL